MATIKYLIQSDSDTAGIYVRLKEGRAIDVKAKTNLIVNPKDWDYDTGGPKSVKTEIGKALNEQLVVFTADLLKHYNKTHRSKVTTNWLKTFINPNVATLPPNPEPEKPTTKDTVITVENITNKVISTFSESSQTITAPDNLVKFFDFYIKDKEHDISGATVTKLNVIKAFMKEMEAWAKQTYLIRDVNKAFRNKFIEFSKEYNYAQNTYARNFKYLKTVCYHARECCIQTSKELTKKLTIKNLKVQHIHLDFKKLDILENTLFNDKALDNARDWLLISCETGQRVSDFLKFDSKMLRVEKNHLLIEFTQKKTKQVMAIPLSKRVKRILKKRNGQFPYSLSDQRYNEHIKKVCEYAGFTELVVGGLQDKKTKRKIIDLYPFWKLVSSHIGRRSFATNYYGIIPTPLLMACTGHTTEKSFLVYIGKSQTEQAMHLAQFIDKPEKIKNAKVHQLNKKKKGNRETAA